MPKDNIPEIRVAGFSEVQWSKKKCEDLLTERNVQHPQSEEYPLVSFTIEDGVTPKTERYERESLVAGDKNAKKYKETRLNDIVYNPANLKFGAIARNKYGNAVFSPIYVTFDVNENFAVPEFVEVLVSKKDFIQDALQYQKGTVYERMSVCSTDFLNLDVKIPSVAEQRQIGSIFERLDNLISQHYHKYEALVTVKKSMLEKMFPKDGETVPEVRFAGFTDPWEQRKAVDIADYSKGNGYSKSDLTENGTPIILYGRLYTKYQFAIDEVDTFATPKDGSIYSQGNEVIIPASGETAEDIARASAVEKSGILLGGDLNILRPFNFINPLFLALTISNGEPQKELAKKAQGKSVVHIHNSDIQEVTVSFPTRAEQDLIVAVFRSLDNLITLHQRKCEVLKNLKSALLSKMFV